VFGVVGVRVLAMTDLPTLHVKDLQRRAGAFRLDVISNGDDTWTLTYWFAGGKTHTETTARCRLILPHEEQAN
jgi:hypothetical protein